MLFTTAPAVYFAWKAWLASSEANRIAQNQQKVENSFELIRLFEQVLSDFKPTYRLNNGEHKTAEAKELLDMILKYRVSSLRTMKNGEKTEIEIVKSEAFPWQQEAELKKYLD